MKQIYAVTAWTCMYGAGEMETRYHVLQMFLHLHSIPDCCDCHRPGTQASPRRKCYKFSIGYARCIKCTDRRNSNPKDHARKISNPGHVHNPPASCSSFAFSASCKILLCFEPFEGAIKMGRSIDKHLSSQPTSTNVKRRHFKEQHQED